MDGLLGAALLGGYVGRSEPGRTVHLHRFKAGSVSLEREPIAGNPVQNALSKSIVPGECPVLTTRM